jgi:hypothetical protein
MMEVFGASNQQSLPLPADSRIGEGERSIAVGVIPGVDEVAFVEHALNATANCPVSPALRVPEVNLVATLDSIVRLSMVGRDGGRASV